MNKIILALLLTLVSFSLPAQIFVSKLSCEYQNNPVGVDSQSPELSWQLSAGQRNTKQTAYRVLVADNFSLLQNNTCNIWDSKKVLSSQSIQIPFSGKALYLVFISGRLEI